VSVVVFEYIVCIVSWKTNINARTNVVSLKENMSYYDSSISE